MTKDVIVIHQRITVRTGDRNRAGRDRNSQEVNYKKNGKHYIIYDEVMEGFEGRHEKYHQADRGFFGCHEKRCDECPYGV